MIHQIEKSFTVFSDEAHQCIFRNFRRACYENEDKLHYSQANKCWKIINRILRGTIRRENVIMINKRIGFWGVIKDVQPGYIRKKDRK